MVEYCIFPLKLIIEVLSNIFNIEFFIASFIFIFLLLGTKAVVDLVNEL